MGYTTNWGLYQRRGEAESTYNYQATDSDIDVLDKLSYKAVSHTHLGTTAMPNPSGAFDYTVYTAGGTLPGGTTYEYAISFLDSTGETVTNTPVALSTTAQITTPSAPTVVATAGGSLSSGYHYYALSVTDGNGDETNISSYIGVATSDNDQVTLTYPSAPAGTISWNIYKYINYGTGIFLATVAVGPATYVDDGSVEPTYARLAPTLNSTNSKNSIEIDITAYSIPAGATQWRIYRRDSGGSWSTTNLVATTAIGSLTATDTNPILNAGTPRTVSTAHGEPAKINIDTHTTGNTINRAVVIAGGTSYLQVPSLTEAEKTALTPANGMIIYQTDGTVGFYIYESSAWVGMTSEKKNLTCFLSGTLVNGQTYLTTTIPSDITPTKVDAYWLTAPTGCDGSNYPQISIYDADATPNTINLDNTGGTALVTWDQPATPIVFSAGVLTFDANIILSPSTNGADVNLVIWY